MKTLPLCLRLFIFSLFLISPALLSGQQTNYLEAWVSTGGTADNFFNNIVSVTNNSNDIYIASSELNGNGNYDLLISKVDKSGTEYWSHTFNLTMGGDVIAGAIALDNNGDVIITGTAFNGINNYDLFVAKYNSSGIQQWNNTYNGATSFYDAGKAIVCDNNNNVYVTGGSFESINHSDMVTICYNSSGIQQWINYFDGNNLHDGGATIGILNPTTIIITGPVQNTSNQWVYAAVQYNISTGVQGSYVVTPSGSTIDEFTALAIDENENVYLAGSVINSTTGFFDYKAFKLDSNLQILWETTLDGAAGRDDIAQAIDVDANGNVYITGYSDQGNGDHNFLTVKYNASGTQQWTKEYDGGGNDQASDLIINDNDEIFVTGFTSKSDKNDFFTTLYDTNGSVLWSAHYNGIHNKNDVAKTIELDADGNVLISGNSEELTKTTYLTVKYAKHEIIIPPDDESVSTAYAYVENRGQIVNTDLNQVEGLKFYNKQRFPNLYFFDDKISFVLASIDTSASTQDTVHRVDMEFYGRDGNRSSTSVMSLDKKSDYYNFYLGHIPEGREKVPLYEKLIYPEVYEDIDLMLSSNGAGTKYYFICKPGADPNDIILNFSGQSGLNIYNNDLHIETSLEDIIIPEATAFQIDGNGFPVTLNWTPSYSINGEEVTFSSGSYNPNQSLIFQINSILACSNQINENGNLNWSTFYHDVASSVPSDIASGAMGESIYVTGIAYDALFPTEGMNVDNDFDGATDAYVVKFSLDYQRQWATFYGGSATDNMNDPPFDPTDEAHSITVDGNENVYFTGRTNCNDFPTFALGNAYLDETIGENFKAFLVKLNGQSGERTWATLFGNNENLEANTSRSGAVAVNSSNHVFISGQLTMGGTGAGYGIEVNDNMGAYYSHDQGSCFIAEFNENNDIEWSTMFGRNNGRTFIYDLAFDSEDDLIMVGYLSNADIGPLTGLDFDDNGGQAWIQNSALGEDDGLIVKFDGATRDLIWSTLFGGAEDDRMFSVTIGENDDIYVFGETQSDNNTFPVFLHPDDDPNIVYYDDILNAFDQDLFIGRFTNEGARNWITYYGGDRAEYAFHGLCYTDNDNIYITGSTLSRNFNIEQYEDFYYQPGINEPDPNAPPIEEDVPDAFIVSFHSNKEIIASSYYGGNNIVTSDNVGETGIGLTAVNDKVFMTGLVYRSTAPCFPTIEPSGNNVWFESSYADGGLDVRTFISEFGDVDFITPVKELDHDVHNKIIVRPNPATNKLNILIQTPEDLISGELEIRNIAGQKIMNYSNVLSNNIALDVSGLPSGTYLLSYRDYTKIISKKFIIIR